MRTIVYGDIHGCLDELTILRSELNVKDDDLEISVGDVLDRGPHSNEALRYLREEGIELILGNHEEKYLRYKMHEDIAKKTGKTNPMLFNEEKKAIYENLCKDDFEYLASAPYFKKIDKLTVVHAGLTNEVDLENLDKKTKNMLIRLRQVDTNQKMLAIGQEGFGSQYWSEVYDGSHGIVVYGHEVMNKVKMDKYSFGIDTGCVYGGKLTALIIEDTKEPMYSYDIVQVAALKKYVIKK